MHRSCLAARSAAVFLVGWCAGTAALAEATASAQVGVVAISYADLAPADGVTPMLTWATDPTWSQSSSQTTAPVAQAHHYAAGNYAPTSVSLNSDLGTTGASTGPQGAEAAATLIGSTMAGVDQHLHSSASPVNAWMFSVTPMTVVTFTSQVRLSAVTTIGSRGGNGEAAGAFADLSVSLDLGHGVSYNAFVDRVAYAGDIYDPETGQFANPPQSVWTEGTMTLTLFNSSATAARGSLWVQVSSSTYSAIPMATVPEPPASALALAGAAALAGVARRRFARR